MVHALGVTGYEGVFRRTCEVTLRLCRKEIECLINVLETLVHDPLLELSHKSRRMTTPKQEAQEHIDTVKNKLLGRRGGVSGVALSIEGQVGRSLGFICMAK